jgi:hypothetical protein
LPNSAQAVGGFDLRLRAPQRVSKMEMCHPSEAKQALGEQPDGFARWAEHSLSWPLW